MPLVGTLECSYEHRRSSTEVGVISSFLSIGWGGEGGGREGFDGLPSLGARFFLAGTGYCNPRPRLNWVLYLQDDLFAHSDCLGCYSSRLVRGSVYSLGGLSNWVVGSPPASCRACLWWWAAFLLGSLFLHRILCGPQLTLWVSFVHSLRDGRGPLCVVLP